MEMGHIMEIKQEKVMNEISNIPHASNSYDNSVCVNIKGNSNIANTGIIKGSIIVNSSLDMGIVQMMLDTLNRNNELLQHLIALHSQKTK